MNKSKSPRGTDVLIHVLKLIQHTVTVVYVRVRIEHKLPLDSDLEITGTDIKNFKMTHWLLVKKKEQNNWFHVCCDVMGK